MPTNEIKTNDAEINALIASLTAEGKKFNQATDHLIDGLEAGIRQEIAALARTEEEIRNEVKTTAGKIQEIDTDIVLPADAETEDE